MYLFISKSSLSKHFLRLGSRLNPYRKEDLKD